jgi:predicted nucleic acid-binding protein
MKTDFIADTNILIYIHEGNKIIEPFIQFDFSISFIAEVELLGFKGISDDEDLNLES